MELVENILNAVKQFASANRDDLLSKYINNAVEDDKSQYSAGRAFAYQHMFNFIVSEIEAKIYGTDKQNVTTGTSSVTNSNVSTSSSETTVSIPLDTIEG